ncbi:MAG: Nramp family divalent metal transporter [Ignavibacteria bacterium]
MNKSLLKTIGPGLLIAATGVGAGDLAGGAFAGSKLGMAVLWAVLLGAFFKFVITEGLTRYQLATGDTLLEGLFKNYGKPVEIFFLVYLLIWSFSVGSALISASGVATHALIPVFDSADTGKIVWGIILSIVGLVIVLLGNYESFEKLMSYCVGLMFLTVLITAAFIRPDFFELVKGTFIPTIPDYINPEGSNQGVIWTLALMGGVGGTLTILSYGYWIREKGRSDSNFLKTCRIDLITAYAVTALFGMSMVIISSQIDLDKQSSSKLVVSLSEKLKEFIGDTGSVIFLVGAWAAVFSSLLGVWQSVPYMFADFWNTFTKKNSGKDIQTIDTKEKPYRLFLLFLTFVPMISLGYKFVFIQKVYAVLGSLVIPFISLALLFLNREKHAQLYSNKLSTRLVLIFIVMLFLFIGLPELFESIIQF